MFRRSILLFSAIAVVTTALITWAVAEVVHDIGLDRCVSGRRVVSCGGDGSETSGVISSLLAVPALFTLVGAYLYLAARLVRAARPKNREALRKTVRVRFTLAFLAAAVISVPATLLLL
ncbi:hypothetical protein Q0Z83_053620 [Actinoplanes sichuanensis]|uniref:Uncharacterized protein n=1 Tax=Actinoplanes sichuanensis TaxID=512349 RepID=A0ABW4AU17_9ACTN|nr:hypothetical protein [Actinoplanes sichuanensis]BEL07171.1 hypothetical protein Q0Z83_053620 [Actinoplanes sichuanensis]